MYRQLAQTEPATYLPDVAATLHNVGVLASSTSRFPEAEAAYQEALALYRQLAPDPSGCVSLPDIATTLTNLAGLYNMSHRFPEAETAYQEALTPATAASADQPRGLSPEGRDDAP